MLSYAKLSSYFLSDCITSYHLFHVSRVKQSTHLCIGPLYTHAQVRARPWYSAIGSKLQRRCTLPCGGPPRPHFRMFLNSFSFTSIHKWPSFCRQWSMQKNAWHARLSYSTISSSPAYSPVLTNISETRTSSNATHCGAKGAAQFVALTFVQICLRYFIWAVRPYSVGDHSDGLHMLLNVELQGRQNLCNYTLSKAISLSATS